MLCSGFALLLHQSGLLNSVTNIRSYCGATTNSDHRLVICDIPKIKWHKIFSNNKSSPKLDSIKLIENTEIQNKYKEKVKDKVKNDINSKEESNQNRWNKIVKYCLEAAEETAGFKKKTNKVENKKITELSNKQLKLRIDINATKPGPKQKLLKQKKNRTLKKKKKS